jgi:hypothetical protein
MQEQFPAGAQITGVPSNEETCFDTPDMYAGNAGAILLPGMACMPEMQEQFPAGAWMARYG